MFWYYNVQKTIPTTCSENSATSNSHVAMSFWPLNVNRGRREMIPHYMYNVNSILGDMRPFYDLLTSLAYAPALKNRTHTGVSTSHTKSKIASLTFIQRKQTDSFGVC